MVGVCVFQFPGHNSEQIAMMTMMEAQGRVGPSGMNGTTPPSAAGLEQSGGNEAVNQMEHPRSGNQSFDRSTPSYGGWFTVFPPPPPPARGDAPACIVNFSPSSLPHFSLARSRCAFVPPTSQSTTATASRNDDDAHANDLTRCP